MDNAVGTKTYEEGAQFLQHAVEEMEKLEGTPPNDMYNFIFGFMMNQMTASAGIAKHGQVALNALMKEFCQLDNKSVFRPHVAKELTHQHRKMALWAINLIKEKRYGKIKACTVSDGHSQQEHYTKDETTSPTISTDALMMSLIIDAKENRDIATPDVKGAYLHANMKDFILLKLTGEAANIVCTVNPEYTKYVAIENGKRVLYMELLKALYGCVQSALLWYELFSTTPAGMGFKINPYDPCVANSMINGKQCTMAWYVDDNKISHVGCWEVTQIIKKIEAKIGKMTVTRGPRHTFLGMKLFSPGNGMVEIRMEQQYLREAIRDSGMEIRSSTVTPAQNNRFVVEPKSEKLGAQKADLFHSSVAKLLYVSKQGRGDLQPAIAFLCTQVSCSTEQDWSKLKQVLQYIHGTIMMKLILGADSLIKMKSWVNAAYAIHNDMKSHTGGCVSFGRGALMSKPTRQKLNVKSSTEAETVGANNFLPSTAWMQIFLAEEGYTLDKTIFYQDNQSAMRMEKNGKASCGQQSRHINIRFFFIKDFIISEGISIEYCPTLQMLANFFTKPLQGALFKKFQGAILGGHTHISTLVTKPLSPSQERVENDTLSKNCDENNGQTEMPKSGKKETNSSPPVPSYASMLKRKPAPMEQHRNVLTFLN